MDEQRSRQTVLGDGLNIVSSFNLQARLRCQTASSLLSPTPLPILRPGQATTHREYLLDILQTALEVVEETEAAFADADDASDCPATCACARNEKAPQ